MTQLAESTIIDGLEDHRKRIASAFALPVDVVWGKPETSGIAAKEAEIQRLRTALKYIKENVSVECNCHIEKEVNYIEPCIYCVAKEALEVKE